MKNLARILVLVFTFTLTTQAQQKNTKKRVQLSTEQQTDLAVKKMTLVLDLSENQQNQIRPLIAEQITERKASIERRKTAKKQQKKPTADEIYAIKNKRLDHQILIKKRMKNILNKEQFEKFEKMKKGRKRMAKKKMKNKKDGMKRKMKKKREKFEENK